MKPALILGEKINSGRITVGALITFHFWPNLIEHCIRAGLDYVIIDTEHLQHDAEAVATGCTMGRLADFPVIVRVSGAESAALRQAMDLGPCGVMVPCVDSLEDMRTIQDAVYMPPRGKRRPGGMGNNWVSDVNYSTWRREVEDHVIVLPQIESDTGLENADDIAAHPLTTAIATGPYDLSASLGACHDLSDPRLIDAKRRVMEAGDKAGKKTWTIGHGPTLVQEGYTFFGVAEPVMAMEGAMKQAADEARGDAAASEQRSDQAMP